VPTATAAQSELVALSPSTFLVLTRDGNGNGSGDAAYNATGVRLADNPQVYKNGRPRVQHGRRHESRRHRSTRPAYAPAVAGGTTATNPLNLAPVAGIAAAHGHVPFVNILNANQLARFGLNTNVLGTAGALAAANAALARNSNSLSARSGKPSRSCPVPRCRRPERLLPAGR
jgi:hypothetical protein